MQAESKGAGERSHASSRRSRWPPARATTFGAWLVLSIVLVASEAARRRFLESHPQPGAEAIAAALRPRPDSFYRVAWGRVQRPRGVLRAGERRLFLIDVRNVGSGVWPDRQEADPLRARGRGAVRLSYRWIRLDSGAPSTDYFARTDLPFPVGPQERVTLPVVVTMPSSPGDYRLDLDLVHEGVCWFESRGGRRLTLPISVQEKKQHGPSR